MVRTQGMKEIARATPPRWFTTNFQNSSPQVVAAVARTVESLNPEGYIGGCCAVRDFDARATVANINVPVLVISATQDPAAPPSDGHFLAEHIPGARYAEMNASHISIMEDPQSFTKEVLKFLAE
jgi:3-oxoadipate enol-lactonase